MSQNLNKHLTKEEMQTSSMWKDTLYHMSSMKHKLKSRLSGEISIISDMEMTPPLWQKMRNYPIRTSPRSLANKLLGLVFKTWDSI